MLESFGLGVPVVASDIPSLREVLGGGERGLLVALDDSRALGAAMLALADRPASDEMRARSFEVFDRQDLSSVGSQMVDWLVACAAPTGRENQED